MSNEFYEKPLPTTDDPTRPGLDDLDRSLRGEKEFGQMGPTDTSQPWRVTDTDSAEWALRHVAEAREAIANADVQAGAWRERIEAWRENEVAGLQRRLAFFEGCLTDYLRRCREEDEKVKSINLPSGAIQSRARAAAIKVEDGAAFLVWARANAPAVIRLKEEIDAGGLKAALQIVEKDDGLVVLNPDSGELVPGVRVEPASVSFTVAT